jgi:HSP20 family molecular chaperone IbpA
MTGQTRILPVRIYEAGVKIMIAAPMPGLAPGDIAVAIDGDHVRIRGAQRGPRQHAIRLAAAEWTVGPWERELRLSRPVSGALANATLGNGVLVLALPRATSEASDGATEITLETIEPTRGERIGHVGRVPRPTTTAEHRHAKHATLVSG